MTEEPVDVELEEGWVATTVHDEFPELRLVNAMTSDEARRRCPNR